MLDLATAKRIVEARKNIEIQCMAGLEQVIGVSLTGNWKQGVELEDKSLIDS